MPCIQSTRLWLAAQVKAMKRDLRMIIFCGMGCGAVVQDLLVASLFRNFLLADRIMRAASCTPASFPRLPSTHQHPMWQVRRLQIKFCCTEC